MTITGPDGEDGTGRIAPKQRPGHLDYERVCREQATAQGLDPVVEVLRGAGVKVEVRQTGGFIMVAEVEDERHHGWLGITQDEEGPGAYYVVAYGGIEDEEGTVMARGVYPSELPGVVEHWATH